MTISKDGITSRRDVLKATAAIPGASFLKDSYGTTVQKAGSVNFTECSLIHDGIPDGSPQLVSDGHRKYFTGEGKVTFSPASPRSEIEAVRERNSIIYQPMIVRSEQGRVIGQNSVPPIRRQNVPPEPFGSDNGVLDQRTISEGEVTTQYIGHQYGAELTELEKTVLMEEVNLPGYDLYFRGVDTHLVTNDGERQIGPGERHIQEFLPKEVKISVRNDEIIEQQDPRRPGQTRPTKRTAVETVSITPKLIVHNHGKLDIYTPEKTYWEMSEEGDRDEN